MRHLTRRQICGCLAVALLAAGCSEQESGPEPIRYGRDTCELCGMILSDPRFAVEIRDPARKLHKFDDLGDAFCWFERQKWKDDRDVEFWVTDSADGKTWIDARKARFAEGFVTPMNWGWAAVGGEPASAVDFDAARAKLAEAAAKRLCSAEPGQAGDR